MDGEKNQVGKEEVGGFLEGGAASNPARQDRKEKKKVQKLTENFEIS